MSKHLRKEEKRELKNKWNLVRQQVKDIQNNKCYLCNKEVYGKSANIHHIIDKRFKELYLDINNLILLCPICHRLGKIAVHNTSIYFSEILRKKEPKRYKYLMNYLDLSLLN